MKRDLEISAIVLHKGQELVVEQTPQFAAWLSRLRDTQGLVRILKRLRRLAEGGFGDCKPVGEGVHELRMFFGPGYRVYFMMRGEAVILLLAGGDKDSQHRDTVLAKELAWKDRDGTED